MIRAFLNGWLAGILCAMVFTVIFAWLDTWTHEREARVECQMAKRGYQANLVIADGNVRIRCGKYLPVVRAKGKR